MAKYCGVCWSIKYGVNLPCVHFEYTKNLYACSNCGIIDHLVVKRKNKLLCFLIDLKYDVPELIWYYLCALSYRYDRYLLKKWEKRYGKREKH